MFEILLPLLLFSNGTASDLVHELTFGGRAVCGRKVRNSLTPISDY